MLTDLHLCILFNNPSKAFMNFSSMVFFLVSVQSSFSAGDSLHSRSRCSEKVINYPCHIKITLHEYFSSISSIIWEALQITFQAQLQKKRLSSLNLFFVFTFEARPFHDCSVMVNDIFGKKTRKGAKGFFLGICTM